MKCWDKSDSVKVVVGGGDNGTCFCLSLSRNVSREEATAHSSRTVLLHPTDVSHEEANCPFFEDNSSGGLILNTYNHQTLNLPLNP